MTSLKVVCFELITWNLWMYEVEKLALGARMKDLSIQPHFAVFCLMNQQIDD